MTAPLLLTPGRYKLEGIRVPSLPAQLYVSEDRVLLNTIAVPGVLAGQFGVVLVTLQAEAPASELGPVEAR